MEKWQVEIITKNKAELQKNINVTAMLLAHLQGAYLISDEEAAKLNAAGLLFGRFQQTQQLLDILVQKKYTNENPPRLAFDAFLKFLEIETQTGAFDLLRKEKDNYLKQFVHEPKVGRQGSTTVNRPNLKRDAILKMEYLALAEEDKPLEVKLEKPSEDMRKLYPDFKMLPEYKGLALIINIKDFSVMTDASGAVIDTRDGSEKDLEYMVNLWKKLGYDIYREMRVKSKTNWTRNEVLDIVERFREECNAEKPESLIIFIGSHGEDGYIFTSDSAELPEPQNKIHVKQDIISKFYDQKCPGLKGKVKLVLVNACQVFSVTQKDALLVDGAVTTDMIVVTSQAPGHASFRNDNSGSWFVHCLTYYIMKCAKVYDLLSILNMTSMTLSYRKGLLDDNKTRHIPSQTATIKTFPLSNDKIYFFIPTEK